MMRILVIGSRGQVGSALLSLLPGDAVGLSRADVDITVRRDLERALDAAGTVDAVINAAAYNAVDQAEEQPELAFAVNADAPSWIAAWTAERGIPLLHFSTEYVFPDGTGEAWSEESDPAPLSVYGASKRAGETAVLASNDHAVIIRTSWVHSLQESNFVRRILAVAAGPQPLTIVNDQFGSPTFAPELARASIKLVEDAALRAQLPNRMLHLAGGGFVSRLDFVRAITREGVRAGVLEREPEIIETSTASFPARARRPVRCVLDCSLAERLGLALAPWQESLRATVEAAR